MSDKCTDIMLLYLPPYSPDLNPIELLLAHVRMIGNVLLIEKSNQLFTGKAYLCQNSHIFQDEEDPILALLDSVGCITADMAEGWFQHAEYIIK